jgi:hypothetical protein
VFYLTAAAEKDRVGERSPGGLHAVALYFSVPRNAAKTVTPSQFMDFLLNVAVVRPVLGALLHRLVLLDTSGSMDRKLLAKALGAIAGYSVALRRM